MFKKYVYLLNDFTNVLLKKDKIKTEEEIKNLRLVLVIVFILFIISLGVNIYLLV
jgi:hypothetical protein